MDPGGVTEVIAHFIGYLQVSEDAIRARLSYDEFAAQRASGGNEVLAGKPTVKVPDTTLDEADSEISRSDYAPEFLDFDFPLLHYRLFPADKFATPHQNPPVPHKPVGPVNGPVDPQQLAIEEPILKPTYTEKIVEIYQGNFIDDSDKFGEPQGLLDELNDIDVQGALDAMQDAFVENYPEHLPPPGSSAPDLLEWALNKSSAEPGGGESGGLETLSVGVFINNEKHVVPPPPDDPNAPPPPHPADALPVPPTPVAPEYAYGQVAQVAELGGNSVSNEAVIVDANEMVQTLVVLGDVYETNAIIQQYGYRDNDQINHVGDPGDPATTVIGDGNIATNLAELVAENPAIDFEFTEFGGDTLHIDFSEGDFYDIKLLKQFNMIFDNDVVVQKEYQAFYKVGTGDNDVENWASIYDASLRYDLIVVGGDYHKVNMISQSNYIIDDDIVKIGKKDGGGENATSEVYTGYNWLFNNAKIHDLGESVFEKLDDFADIKTFAELLRDGLQEGKASEIPDDLPGMHGRAFNVLFAKGNYYDMNVIYQHNTIVDIDGAIQYFGGADEAFKQFASTGNNSSTNKAEIVDIGTLDKQYIGGTHYEDSILIQAELLGEDGNKISYNDTTKLVTEVIAFTEEPDENSSADDGAGLGVASAHHDLLGNLLS